MRAGIRAALCALAFTAYANSFGLDLAMDSRMIVTADPRIRAATAENLGLIAAGYHWLNFLLHLVNVWLVYELALLLFRRAGPAFFAAALWAVHPIATESVTNIAGRADLLAAMAVLGGLLVYARSGVMKPWRAAVALFAIATVGSSPRKTPRYSSEGCFSGISAARRHAPLPAGSLPMARRRLP